MKAEVSMPSVMRATTLSVKVKVTGQRRTKFRIWLGSKIFMLGAAVMGCNIEMDIEP